MGGLAIIGGLLRAVAMPLIDLFGKALAVWSAYRAGKREGRAEQAVADLQETAKTVRKANEGRASVGSSDRDVDELLKPPSTRGRK